MIHESRKLLNLQASPQSSAPVTFDLKMKKRDGTESGVEVNGISTLGSVSPQEKTKNNIVHVQDKKIMP